MCNAFKAIKRVQKHRILYLVGTRERVKRFQKIPIIKTKKKSSCGHLSVSTADQARTAPLFRSLPRFEQKKKPKNWKGLKGSTLMK